VTLIDKNTITAKNHWDLHPDATVPSQWTSNPLIYEAVCKKISAGETSKHWVYWLNENYFKGKTFKSMLSPGCGTGEHEIMVAKSGLVESIDAFDLSENCIDLAKGKAQKNGCNINFYNDDLNTFVVPDTKKYDLILCSGAAHHVKELERFFSVVSNCLAPNGYFILNEYVGDCYNIYRQEQYRFIERILSCFSSELREPGKGAFRNPSIQEVMAHDPSESIRSKLIPSFVEYYFDIEIKRSLGGFLLHPLYPFLKTAAFENRGVEKDTIVKLLIEFEAILMEHNIIESDFDFYVCRPKHKS
jgi:SAM-dependent methyltransferase